MSQYLSKFKEYFSGTPESPKDLLLKSKRLKDLYKAKAGTKKELAQLDETRIEVLTLDNIYNLYMMGWNPLTFTALSCLSNEQIGAISKVDAVRYPKRPWTDYIKPSDLQDYAPEKITFMTSKAACEYYRKHAELWEVAIIYDLFKQYAAEPINHEQIDLDNLAPLLIELYKRKIGDKEEEAAKNLMLKFIGNNLHLFPIMECLIGLNKWQEAKKLLDTHYFSMPFNKIFESILKINDKSDDFTSFADIVVTGLIDLHTNSEYLQKAIEQNSFIASRIIKRLKEAGGVKPPYELDFKENSIIKELFEGVKYNENARDTFKDPGLAILWLGGDYRFFGELDDAGCCIS